MKIEPVVAALEAVAAARGPMHRILLTPSAPRFDQRAARRLATHAPHRPALRPLRGHRRPRPRGPRRRVPLARRLRPQRRRGGRAGDRRGRRPPVRGRARQPRVRRPRQLRLSEQSTRSSTCPPETGTWLECPQYTRPPVFRGLAVPPVLLAGDHAEVARWRAEQAWQRTWALRPDLRPHRRLPDTTRRSTSPSRTWPRRTCPRHSHPALVSPAASRTSAQGCPRSKISAPHPQAPARQRRRATSSP
jgi:hypothetical protein